jgi:hypothetical protein
VTLLAEITDAVSSRFSMRSSRGAGGFRCSAYAINVSDGKGLRARRTGAVGVAGPGPCSGMPTQTGITAHRAAGMAPGAPQRRRALPGVGVAAGSRAGAALLQEPVPQSSARALRPAGGSAPQGLPASWRRSGCGQLHAQKSREPRHRHRPGRPSRRQWRVFVLALCPRHGC